VSLNRGWTYRERIDARGAGRSVLEYLAERYRHSSAATWSERVARGEVEIDGVVAPADAILRAGQVLSWRRAPWTEAAVPTQFAVVYEDESVLVVDKPSGLPTMPAGGFVEHTLLALVRTTHPAAVPVHRLGRGTSGLVLFALTRPAATTLHAAFRDRTLGKHYRALVTGVVPWDAQAITVPIGRVPHPLLGAVHAATPGGAEAHTDARVLERSEATTIVAATIHTGRPHQIRIHLASAGFPLAGDPLYAAGGMPRPETAALPGDGGYLLHAERLQFVHPASGAAIEVVAAPPAPLRTVAERQAIAGLGA
jgi:23S rRNA pseudouridine1911/1915/1917 synthase